MDRVVNTEAAPHHPPKTPTQPGAEQGRPARFVVLGTSGSGKTTFARQLAAKLGVPHIELDALHWDPNWTEAPDNVFRWRIDDALSTSTGWVVDGNYHRFSDLTWAGVQALVWLDYPLWLTMARIVWRTVSRGVRRTELWNGNRESRRTGFLSKDSVILGAQFAWPSSSRVSAALRAARVPPSQSASPSLAARRQPLPALDSRDLQRPSDLTITTLRPFLPL